MPLIFISLSLEAGLAFPSEIEWCEEHDGVVSKALIASPPISPRSPKLVFSTESHTTMTRSAISSQDATRSVHSLLRRPEYRAVSSAPLRDRHLLRALCKAVGLEAPPVLDLAMAQRMAVTSIFRDRPDMMPCHRIVDEMISQSAAAELYRDRLRGPEPDDASSAWWRWRDVQSRARVRKLGFDI